MHLIIIIIILNSNHAFFSIPFIPLSLQPTPVILLKEGTDTSQGVPQLVSNINACQVSKTLISPLYLFSYPS